MIRHNNRNACFLRCAQRLGCRDTVITGNDRVNAVRCGFLNKPFVDPVSVADSFRQTDVAVRAKKRKRAE